MPRGPYVYGALCLWIPMPMGSWVYMPIGSCAYGFLCLLVPVHMDSDYKSLQHIAKVAKIAKSANSAKIVNIVEVAHISEMAKIVNIAKQRNNVSMPMGAYAYGFLCLCLLGFLCLWVPMPMDSNCKT